MSRSLNSISPFPNLHHFGHGEGIVGDGALEVTTIRAIEPCLADEHVAVASWAFNSEIASAFMT